MTDKELLELREEIAKLRERVAVLERVTWGSPHAPIPGIIPPFVSKDPWKPPYEITCVAPGDFRLTPTAKYMAKQEAKG